MLVNVRAVGAGIGIDARSDRVIDRMRAADATLT